MSGPKIHHPPKMNSPTWSSFTRPVLSFLVRLLRGILFPIQTRRRRQQSLLMGIVVLLTLGLLVTLYTQTRSRYHWENDGAIGQERVWNGGTPLQIRPGSCWCNSKNPVLYTDQETNQVEPSLQYKMIHQEYCMCTPNLAIDIILYSSSSIQHEENGLEDDPSSTTSIWLVRRKDTGQLATIGGFVQVGETTEQAVYREVLEETGYHLLDHKSIGRGQDRIVQQEGKTSLDVSTSSSSSSSSITLLGVYSDPTRDSRRHTVSVAYYCRIPDTVYHLQAADDVKDVIKVPMSRIAFLNSNDFDTKHDTKTYHGTDFFSDHATILQDFQRAILGSRTRKPRIKQVENHNHERLKEESFMETIDRSICPRY